MFRVTALALALASAVQAETVVDAEGLQALEGAAYWAVVDVRALSDRSSDPIPNALEFAPDLDVSGPVLVLASDDEVARATAKAIESRLRTVEAYAVAGGMATLRTIRPDLLPSILEGNMPGTFTIPHNTCQTGKPLHTFSDANDK